MRRRIPIHHRQPRGFSLIEILIVISILAALVALSLTVLGTAGNAANVAATRATITKVDALLRDQLAGFNRTQGNPTTLAEIVAKKGAAQAGFPQSSFEALGSSYADTDITASSELLYKIITEGRVTGATPVGEDAFNGSELADTDGDTNLELVDAWGNPLRFYRWPTRLLNPFGHIKTTLSGAINNSVATISLADTSEFDAVISAIQNTSNGGDANASIFLVIGNEIIEVPPAGYTSVIRGAAGTSAEAHHDGATVKLAPFPQLVSLLMGSLTVGGATSDPDDPRGSLLSVDEFDFETDYTTPQGIPYGSLHTLDSYHAPLIISAGPDGILGLLEPYDESNKGNLAIPDTSNGSDLSTIVNPGSTALSDNITNLSGGN